MKQTTTKPTLLAYRPVGSGNKYNLLTGVLKGLSIDQVYMIPKQSISGVSYGDNFYYAETGQLWLFGGASNYGSVCGLAYVSSYYAWSASGASSSARLAYYGSLNKVSETKMKELGNTI